ncbi:MAG: AAA family ATPase [Bacilli bacterium]|jgi:uncharacterized protein|nr:AAA family ATPase [Bacilli bacterium]
MFKRKIYDQMLAWKESLKIKRKGLIIRGLRQVGKTTVAQEFAAKEYENVVYINFKKDRSIHSVFAGDLDVDRLIIRLSAALPKATFVPQKTVLIFDEIQECANARSSIKYFAEDKQKRFDIIATGSLLGLRGYNRKQNEGPSTGFEYFLDMKPMDFEEFLWAIGIPATPIDYVKKCFSTMAMVDKSVNDNFSKYFKDYLCVGGMPEAVDTFIQTKNMSLVLTVQRNILSSYKDDFGKHLDEQEKEYIDTSELAKIQMIYDSIPSQLAKDNKKFQYRGLGSHARGRDYIPAIQWLVDFGLISLCHNLDTLELPLKGNEIENNFKIYVNDTGLFVAMLEEGSAFSILQNELGIYKGAIYENIVADALTKNGLPLFYFSKNSGLEIDFVTRHDNQLTLIEVKAKNNNAKSLKTVLEDKDKYQVRSNYKLIDGNVGSNGLINTIPQYMAFLID